MTRRDCLLLATAGAYAQPKPASWRQWGGPNRDFQVPDSPAIKAKWPASGPKVVWKRALGDGYSSPSIDNGVLYTMYASPGGTATIAADAATGRTIWEQTAAANFRSEAPDMGHGPYATPLIATDRIFTAGVTGRIECRARKDGALLWKQELWSEHRGTRLAYGYASSPIAFRDTIIMPCGGKGKSLMAFRQSDGAIAWAANDFPNVYSSPILISVDGLEQLVALMDGYVFGVNPHNGDLQWRIPFKASYSIAVASPVWAPGNLLFVSSEYDAGTKVIKLERKGMQTEAKEVWSANRLRLHHGNAICHNGTIYFSSGGKGSVAVLSAVDIATGKIHWQDRVISKASFVWADNKLITLDQDGNLMLAQPSPQGFQVLAKAEVLTNLAWTPPVLAGSRLYLRDRKSLLSIELG
ncbi:MAG: PQQ-binding-like beta-propeller repeat protein [Acidobacteria bacterium]|nr:PQQ-binding-like beta-propeller repeat protein [Acidobacteriota bacterium]